VSVSVSVSIYLPYVPVRIYGASGDPVIVRQGPLPVRSRIVHAALVDSHLTGSESRVIEKELRSAWRAAAAWGGRPQRAATPVEACAHVQLSIVRLPSPILPLPHVPRAKGVGGEVNRRVYTQYGVLLRLKAASINSTQI
jgi:hypothetical protein